MAKKTNTEKSYKKARNTAIAATAIGIGCGVIAYNSGRKARELRPEAKSAKASRKIDRKSGRYNR